MSKDGTILDPKYYDDSVSFDSVDENDDTFKSMAAIGVKPEDIVSADRRKMYEDYLKRTGTQIG